MRMYLSSFRVGDHPDRLLALLGDAPPDVAVIANAMDAQTLDERLAGVEREATALSALGLKPTEIDLRDYFGRPRRDIAAALAPFPLVWLRGGSAFMLRYALARSGADRVLTARLRRDDIVYAGYSAGPCVLAPSLRGLELCDDAQQVVETYGEPPIWDGLGILDYALVPHYESPDHPETQVLGVVAATYRAANIPHRTLRDGQVLLIDGDDVQLL
jgi:dipeptidase E